MYSFLTLDTSPNPDRPHVKSWDGAALYENMTAADVMKVIKKTSPAWKNQYNWQRTKIQALMDATHANGAKFIWSVGGWSDLTLTLEESRVDDFAAKVVQLLQVAGDGIDIDWEHLSTDPLHSDEQSKTLGQVFLKLRRALDAAGLKDKSIGYTTRWNAFYDDATRPKGWKVYASDGEGLKVEKEL